MFNIRFVAGVVGVVGGGRGSVCLCGCLVSVLQASPVRSVVPF